MADLLAIHDNLFGAETSELQRRVKAQILVTARREEEDGL